MPVLMSQHSCPFRPHRGAPRQIQKNQKIHDSVYMLMKPPKTYKPKARFPDSTQWDSEQHKMLWMEKDPYTETQEIVGRFFDWNRSNVTSDAESLRELCRTGGPICPAFSALEDADMCEILRSRGTQRGVGIGAPKRHR